MDKTTFIQKAALLQPTYQPNNSVKQQFSQVDLIITVGPTGVGKTTIMEHSALPFVTSDVTREPRKGEENGIDYNFRKDYEELFRELQNGEFVQYIVYPNGEFYGTKAKSYPESGPCTIAIITSNIPFFFTLGFRSIKLVYILPPSYEIWMKRTQEHHDKDLPARLGEAKTSIEAALADDRYLFIINDDLLTARDIFKNIAYGQPVDLSQQSTARQLALSLLTQIQNV